MARISRLGHVAIQARSPAKLASFYHDLLGMQVVAGDPGRHVAFLAADPSANPHDLAIVANPRLAHVAFYVDTLAELREVWRLLKERGIPIRLCQMISIGIRLEFLDPEENVIEVTWLHGRPCEWPYFQDVDLEELTDADVANLLDALPAPEENAPAS